MAAEATPDPPILRQIKRVWNDKAVGLIHDIYLHNVRTHSSSGESYGREDALTHTLQQLAAFPDLRLRAETVISKATYLSQKVTRVAHNTGYSTFGAATNKRICYRVMSDFHLHEGRVVELWEVQDGLLLAKQLGLSARAATALLAQGFTASHSETLPTQLPPEPLPQPATDDTEALVRWFWHELWNRRRLDRIAQMCVPNYRFYGPSGRRLHSSHRFTAYVLGLLAAFPDGVMRLEHVLVNSGKETARVAVRWRFTGTHEGPGYGAATGRSVNLLGMTHHHLQAGHFTEEHTLFDELALLVQLYEPEEAIAQDTQLTGAWP